MMVEEISKVLWQQLKSLYCYGLAMLTCRNSYTFQQHVFVRESSSVIIVSIKLFITSCHCSSSFATSHRSLLSSPMHKQSC